ncbi:MAG: hypothetical protein CVU48_05275 [Candidatus Cloacimonetes bacterium HGW-Cloacimonetes-1]|jgi:hypothetical protein|nr:MAG: hypothetical protein CVU48_05275 [Candidatus Cloacimonetes bacterium HGW-Cloacimonetes-1]
MSEMNDKMQERWNQRRRKGNNWSKLIVMVVALVGIIWGINKLGNSSNINLKSGAESVDSLSADSTQTESIK